MTEEELREFIAHQRQLGMAQVNIALDELCEHYGWDPVKVWREPHYREQDRRMRRLRYQWIAGEMAGMSVMRPARGSSVLRGLVP